jgi:thioredoxin 1
MGQELITIISAKEFDQVTFDSDRASIVFFGAGRCQVCKELLPVVEEIAPLYQGRINVYRVDVDQDKPLFQRFRLRGIPNLLLIDNGEVKQKVGGLHTKDELITIINQTFEFH